MNYKEFKKIIESSDKVFLYVRYLSTVEIIKSNIDEDFYDMLVYRFYQNEEDLKDLIAKCGDNNCVIG